MLLEAERCCDLKLANPRAKKSGGLAPGRSRGLTTRCSSVGGREKTPVRQAGRQSAEDCLPYAVHRC